MKHSLILASNIIQESNSSKHCLICDTSLSSLRGHNPKFCKTCRKVATLRLQRTYWAKSQLKCETICACGCGDKTSTRGKYRRGHYPGARFKAKNFFSLDFSNPDASYLLGAIQGDGSVVKRICKVTIAVGLSDKPYADELNRIFNSLGVKTKIVEREKYFDVYCVSKQLTDQLINFKSNSLWKLPENLHKADWIAGLVDTDGSIGKSEITISQKDNGNLELANKVLLELGFKGHSLRKYQNHKIYKDFVISLLKINWLQDLKLFVDLIPLRHPRKKDWLLSRIVNGRLNRRVKGAREFEHQIYEILREGELKYQEIAKRLNIPLETLRWKILEMKKKGFLTTRRKYIEGRHFVTMCNLRSIL